MLPRDHGAHRQHGLELRDYAWAAFVWALGEADARERLELAVHVARSRSAAAQDAAAATRAQCRAALDTAARFDLGLGGGDAGGGGLDAQTTTAQAQAQGRSVRKDHGGDGERREPQVDDEEEEETTHRAPPRWAIRCALVRCCGEVGRALRLLASPLQRLLLARAARACDLLWLEPSLTEVVTPRVMDGAAWRRSGERRMGRIERRE